LSSSASIGAAILNLKICHFLHQSASKHSETVMARAKEPRRNHTIILSLSKEIVWFLSSGP